MTAPQPYSQLWRWDVQKYLVAFETGAVSIAGPLTVTSSLITPAVQFPATQVPSSDPNTLDDYEEGTWTPVLTAGSGTLTSYTATGTYTKIGRMVFLYLEATLTNIGSGAGALNVAGLPFTPAANSSGGGRENAVGGFWYSAAITSGSTNMAILKYDNTTPIVVNYQHRITAMYRT